MTWTTCFFRVENKVEFTFWCLRYIFTFIMFILGIKAPGISTVRDYYSRYTDVEVSLGSKSFFGRFMTNFIVWSNRSWLTLFKYLSHFRVWYEMKTARKTIRIQRVPEAGGTRGASLEKIWWRWCRVCINHNFMLKFLFKYLVNPIA